MDIKSGFIAANCLDLIGKQVNKNTKHSVYVRLSQGQTSNYTLDKIYIHPDYNPSTFANNIAVVEYNTESTVNWTNFIAIDRTSWVRVLYSRRLMRDVPSLRWNNADPNIAKDIGADCKNSSGIYDANSDSFVCGDWTMSTTLYNRDCTLPFGTVYAATPQMKNLSIAGIYSHTAVYGDDMCYSPHKVSYYTLLYPYVDFVARVLGRTPKTVPKPSKSSNGSETLVSMKDASELHTTGITYFGGDLYAIGSVRQKTPSKSDPNESDSDPGLESPIPASTSSPAQSQPPPNGLTTKQTIIVGTVVPIVVIILAIVMYFAYKKYKKRQNLATWDPRNEQSNINAQNIARELGGDGPARHTMLPTYAEIEYFDALANTRVNRKPSEEDYISQIAMHTMQDPGDKHASIVPAKS
ncbi:hypothetical protein GGI12_000761 [Dipsacomyces acuminosporus]|nr:hypothetical protein GGI12_000761 [Dipsacomyces acuminosporus]